MDGKHIDTVAGVAQRPRRTAAAVRRRWLVGSGTPGRRVVLNVARPDRRDRPGADQAPAGDPPDLL